MCCLESFSALSARSSRVVSALVVEQHRGGDERAGEAAAAGLVGARHEADSERAVEGEQAVAAALVAGCGGARGCEPTRA